MARKPRTSRTVETLIHEEATRRNIPTAEYQSVMRKEQQDPVRVAYEHRNRDLDGGLHRKQPSGDEALEARIAELERFCGQLSLENRILKKSLKRMHSPRGMP